MSTSPDPVVREHPTQFGVFKPVGCVVASFPTSALADTTVSRLLADGFTSADITRYTAEQMTAQAEYDLKHASTFASLGQDLNLVKSQLTLALQGQSFLVIKAPDDASVQRVVAAAQAGQASRAQLYGHLLVEELLPLSASEHPQVAESPDRGLDT